MQPPEQHQRADDALVQLGELLIDLDRYLIHYPDGRDASLTLRERELLRVLIREHGRVLSYADLGLYAWHYPDSYYSPHGIRNCICRLRRKLGDSASAIQAVRNVGYRLGQPTLSRSDATQSSGRNRR